MIKIKTFFANFESEKQFKVKKALFHDNRNYLIGDKQPFLTNTPFLHEVKIKFLQIQQDTICTTLFFFSIRTILQEQLKNKIRIKPGLLSRRT